MGEGCDVAVDLSSNVRRWISRQAAVGEESLTDWLLYELSDRLSWVHYLKFNRHQEARSTGADWDWWFVGDGGSLALRVQAKRLRFGEDCYKGLAHTNRHGLQIEKLIESSTSKNLMPMYALYSSPSSDPSLLCGGRPAAAGQDGVFIAGAIELYNGFITKGRGKVEASEVLERSNPLSCLFCCPKSPLARAVGGGPDRFSDWFRIYYKDTVEGMMDRLQKQKIRNIREDQSPGFHREPAPAVVGALQNIEEGIPDWYEQEFSRYMDDTNALVIFDLRGRFEDHHYEP